MGKENVNPAGDGLLVPVKAVGNDAGNISDNGRIRLWIPPNTSVLASPASSSQGRGVARRKKCRGSLNLKDSVIVDTIEDSGSDIEVGEDSNGETGEDDGAPDSINFCQLRRAARQMRSYIVMDQEGMDDNDCEWVLNDDFVRSNPLCQYVEGDSEDDSDDDSEDEQVRMKSDRMEVDGVIDGNERGFLEEDSAATTTEDTNFTWSEDFTSFTGQKESYLRVPGPTFSFQDPSEIFCKIWDSRFMETVAKETNKYACDVIDQLSDPDIGTGIPKYLDTWTEVTVEELYRFFTMIILTSLCLRSRMHEYWETGVLGMPAFREIMSRNRYLLINKFLHFACNDNLSTRRYDRKVEKVALVVDHCNRKFAEMYTPSQYLSLDESLLLWKGSLSWKQCMRSKAARFGIKSFELCEAETGYLLQYRLYVGKSVNEHPKPLHGFKSHTAKVVLDLMEGYLNVGHVVVMDNWYNQLSLTRYLKSQRTDVLGTLNRRRRGIPEVIKDLEPNQVERGMTVSRHSGDIALVAWKDVKLVTFISTYHQHEMVPRRRAGQVIQKPVVVKEYHRYVGGVDLKDAKLSMFLMERKQGQKWYMKVFRRLLNTSLLNAYIIYTRNPVHPVYTHRQFRLKLAEGLLSRFSRVSSGPIRAPHPSDSLRLQPGLHFPVRTEASNTGKNRLQLRCVRCVVQKKRVLVTLKCRVCQVPLCVDQCWLDYHTLENL